MTSQQQVERLLSMVPYLQTHDGVTLDTVAERFDISPRQVRADLAVLYMCGLPGLLPGDLIEIDMDAVDGRGTIHLSNADYLSRPLRFSQAEATALLLGLRSLREVAGPEARRSIDSALEKLRSVAPQHASSAERVQVMVPGPPDEVRRTIETALAGPSRLRIDYDTHGETQTRVVDPAAVELREGYAYLEAWDVERAGWRSFRTDRIAAAEATGEPAEPREDQRVGWDERLARADPVTLRVRPGSRWITEYVPIESAVEEPDGDTTVTLRVADRGWLRALLLRIGPDLVSVQPPEFAEPARQAARTALRRYRADPDR